MSTLEQIRVDAPTPVATLVLVHGAWHAAWCWQEGFAQRLAERGISTVAPSLRSHGGSASSRHLNRHRMKDYTDDVEQVLRDTAAGSDLPLFVAGHSMGGAVVQHLLGRSARPRLAGAALLAAVPPRGVIGVTLGLARREFPLFAAANATLNLGRLVATPEQVRERFFRPRSTTDVVERTAARMQSESYLAFLDMLALDRPTPTRIPEPLLVVGAAEDTIFPTDDVIATATAWGTTAVIVDDLGHDLMLDDGWEQVAELLADWVLAQVGEVTR